MIQSLPRNPPNCIIFEICVFDKLILAKKLHSKTLQSFATCLSVSNNLCEKSVSSVALLVIYDDSLRITFPPYFAANFDLSSCEFDNLRLHCYTDSFYTDVILNEKKICNCCGTLSEITFTILSQFVAKNLK